MLGLRFNGGGVLVLEYFAAGLKMPQTNPILEAVPFRLSPIPRIDPMHLDRLDPRSPAGLFLLGSSGREHLAPNIFRHNSGRTIYICRL
jgi:hypothetical protein